MPPRRTPSRAKRPRVLGSAQWLVLEVRLADVEPVVWRRIGVPDHYSLHQLHRVLQLAVGWLDYHLYSFAVGRRRFEAPDPETEAEDATSVRLAELALKAGSRFTYTYDLGDDWRHEIHVASSSPLPAADAPHALPRLLGGANAAPPEDAGGPPGFAELLEALRDPRHPEHRASREWVGEDYEPTRFDAWSTDRHLQLAAAWGAV